MYEDDASEGHVYEQILARQPDMKHVPPMTHALTPILSCAEGLRKIHDLSRLVDGTKVNLSALIDSVHFGIER